MKSSRTALRPRITPARIAWSIAYVATLLGIVVVVLRTRQATLDSLDTPEARREWQAWRDAEPNQSDAGPVRRRRPTVSEPPALMLMRDHFPVVMSAAILFGSLLFAAAMLAVKGALSRTVGAPGAALRRSTGADSEPIPEPSGRGGPSPDRRPE